jgi:hypothetical protein
VACTCKCGTFADSRYVLLHSYMLAVMVWARALGIILPLSARLGALLCTLRKAAEEAAVLVPVLVVVVLGFGTTLFAVYEEVIPRYSTLAGSLRMLVAITGGELNLMVSNKCHSKQVVM